VIPIFSPIPQYETLKPSIDKVLLDVAASGHYILGPQVQQFEEEFAAVVGTDYAVGVNSGTDALLLALRALDIGPGDEVITTSFSYIATSEVIVRVGARPVFVDIDSDTFNFNLEAVEKAITERTKAIIPVHLFGLAVDMTELMALAKRHNLYVVEDCAQATGATWHGQPVGSYGDFGCFSFFPTKNLGALGDAGALTTNNAQLAERVKSLRVHGCTPQNRYDHQESGINSRLDTMQAAVLLVKLPSLESWNTERRRIAQFYTEQINGSELNEFLVAPGVATMTSLHAFHQYTVRLKSTDPAVRNRYQEQLKEAGVMAMIYYPIPLHLQKTHEKLGYKPGDLPVSERVAHQVLSLPIYPGLTKAQQETVIQALKQTVATAVSR
jgi:dTDP-4-amino-4,6-dideoxygalactose transaminase